MKNVALIVYLTLFYFFLNIFCSCNHKSFTDSIRCINIADTIIGYNPTKGSPPSTLDLNYNIYYYKDLVLYRYFYTATMYFENELISSEQRICYTVHHKDSLYGWYYDSYPFNNTKADRRVNIDSIHKRPDNRAYDTLLSFKPDSAYWNDDRSLFYEIYHLRNTKPTARYHLTYTPSMNEISASMSQKLDSARNLKLIRVYIVTDEMYSEKYSTLIPKMEQIRRMKEIPVENRQEILFYFNKYK